MTISKAQWTTDGNDIRLSMPLSKVDQEKRIVSGFATLDNLDKQADIVTPEASLNAFKRFRGNIREMHQPISVGKMVSFKEEKFFDPETKKMYNGIYVSAYVSKGAQDTWEKVLDGTLSGFSIGGRMNKWDDAYDEKMDSAVRIIKDYDLTELSLVDNPANQFANILSVQKADGVNEISGIAADTTIENVFYDKESGIAMLSEEETMSSPISGEPMQNIGFVEKNDSEKSEMIKFLVDSAKGINLAKMTKEVSPMTEETTVEAAVENTEAADVVVENAEVAPEAEVVADAPAADVEKSDVVEKSDDKDEDDKPGTEVMEESDDASGEEDDKEEAKKSDDVADISKAVAEMKDSVTSAFSDLVSTIKSMQEEISVLTKSLDSVKSEVTESKSVFNEFGKRVDAVEADTAFRKSGDIGDIVQEQPETQVEKSIWGGRFLKTADLFR
jgi:Putative phage serine protease XkdF